MRESAPHRYHAQRALAALAGAVLLSGSALASERLVMSLDCRVEGRDLHLSPTSSPREYAILGKHEQEAVTTCSPADPALCRTWRLHRFDVDCHGARVSWLDIVGANAYQRRYPARVDNGRLIVGMGRSWAEPPRGALGMRARQGSPVQQRRNRVVELPAGFAPTLGIDARFVAADPAAATSLSRPPGRDAVAVTPPLPNPARRAAAPPQGRGGDTETTADDRPPAPETRDASTTAAAPAPAQEVRIINAPGTVREPGPTAAPEIAAEQSAAAAAGPATTTTTGSIGKADPGEPALANLPAAPSADALPSIPPLARNEAIHVDEATIGVLAAGGLLAAALLGVLIAARRRSARRRHNGPTRDFAAISLDAGGGSTALVPTPPEPRLTLPAIVAATPHHQPDPVAASPLDRLPETRTEALTLLGVAPDASAEVIKRVVDGLRQSWHPDLARNELDRIVREKRMKQINVAWDLVSARSQAA